MAKYKPQPIDLGDGLPKPTMQFKYFRAGTFTSWDEMFQGVADFASTLGPGRIVSISQSEDKGTAVVTVWYWG